ncbi:MAG: hypothetical protein JST28_05815 [Acidobacteria bacterium]|nr:hypothetical protein [Acidobacteriota bacterium]
MRRNPWLVLGLAVLSLFISVSSAAAQKVSVNVLYRQDSDIVYHAVIPGYSGPNADVTGACTLDPDPANCPDPKQNEDQKAVPTYLLSGTTLSLGLPDGRIALVNCVSRHSANGNYINRHSCGMPLTERADAEFVGQSAKLSWTLAVNGNRTESETYRVVAVLAKPGDNQVASNQAPDPETDGR